MGMSTFRRGLVISPFQIPLLVYLMIEGVLLCLGAPEIAAQLTVPEWSLWNLGIVLSIGSALATFSRFNDNERLETFGLLLVLLGVGVALGISLVAGDYHLGDEIAIGLGCWFRTRVLSKARKAEKVAIQISEETNYEGEKP
jgi:hypothetical protein